MKTCPLLGRAPGLVASLARPGGNITGLSNHVTSAGTNSDRVRGFQQGLKETGHVEGGELGDRIPLGRQSNRPAAGAGGGIAGIAVNASLAFIEGAKPKGEVECALGSAEATASIEMLPRKRPRQPDCSRLRNSGGGSSGVRSGGAQFVRVEHVHVNEGWPRLGRHTRYKVRWKGHHHDTAGR